MVYNPEASRVLLGTLLTNYIAVMAETTALDRATVVNAVCLDNFLIWSLWPLELGGWGHGVGFLYR